MTDEKTAKRAAGVAADADDPPPLLRSWRNVYLLVAGELALIVALFAALTWWAS
jgi:hypothetical protein